MYVYSVQVYLGNVMQTVNISDFRANLLKYLEIANLGGEILVTSNGKQLATIAAPVDQKSEAKKQLAELAVKAKIHDVTSPVDSEWDVMS